MQEGQYTKTIYTLIKNHQYADAVAHLEPIRQVRLCLVFQLSKGLMEEDSASCFSCLAMQEVQ